jgi:5-formyltetrahydrofolate cyclo-ligase
LGNDGEFSPHLAIQSVREQGVITLLPVLHSLRKGYLNFQHYHLHSEFKPNRYGIPEPIPNAEQTVPLSEIDVIFLPLVAFDKAGNRLGMGGGYYDRTLSKWHEMSDRPRLIGLAHDIQQVESLPFQPWDIPIEMIITPTRQIQPSLNLG